MTQAPGILTINLQALQKNYALLRARVGEGCIVGGVVKADAYGLYADKIAPALYAAGCRHFFVAKPAEALTLTDLPDDASIIVMNGFYESYGEQYAQHSLVPVLGSFMEIERYKALSKSCSRKLPAFLKFNTRMNRLGLGAIETKELLGDMSMLDGIDVQAIMSHFACADEADHSMNNIQFEIFEQIANNFDEQLPGTLKTLCNSSGIFLGEKYHFDLVRPGMALYGLNPVPDKPNPMHPVVKVMLPVIRTRIVYKDAHVGYGATYRFDEDTPIATVSAGYADGIFRCLSNKGKMYWKGYPCPIRGRISMDLTSVDLSAVPKDERPKPGDFLELIGEHQSADELAEDAGTIGYEILTSLGKRYKREYI